MINGQAMTVVGVAPRGFKGTTLSDEPDIFVPLTMRGLLSPGFNGFQNRRQYWAYLFGRLKPGVSIDQATVAINGPYRAINRLRRRCRRHERRGDVASRPRRSHQAANAARAASTTKRGRAVLRRVTGTACDRLSNIANLLLVRGRGRAAEMPCDSICAKRGS